MSSYLSFESDRLYLRPTTEEDAALVLAILTAPKALKFIGDRNLHSEEDAREYIRQRALVQLRERGYANYTLVTKETGPRLGFVDCTCVQIWSSLTWATRYIRTTKARAMPAKPPSASCKQQKSALAN